MTAPVTVRPPRPRIKGHRWDWLQLLTGGSLGAKLAFRLGLQGPIEIVRHRVVMEGWAPGVAPLRIAFLSDLHTGGVTDPRTVHGAFDALSTIEPELVLYGGDFVNRSASSLERFAPRLAAVAAPLGSYAVLGNHDLVYGPEYVSDVLERAGVAMLTNRSVSLDTPGRPLSIVGLDDDLFGDPDPGAAFAGVRGPTIVLMHAPGTVLDLDPYPFRLALCGHVHGGQIALPNGRPIVLPLGRAVAKYPRGRFELGAGRTLIVSRGVGASGVPIRLFARSEITVVELVAGDAPAGVGR